MCASAEYWKTQHVWDVIFLRGVRQLLDGFTQSSAVNGKMNCGYMRCEHRECLHLQCHCQKRNTIQKIIALCYDDDAFTVAAAVISLAV